MSKSKKREEITMDDVADAKVSFRVTMWMPADLIKSYKAEALKKGKKYQALMKEALQEKAKNFDRESPFTPDQESFISMLIAAHSSRKAQKTSGERTSVRTLMRAARASAIEKSRHSTTSFTVKSKKRA